VVPTPNDPIQEKKAGFVKYLTRKLSAIHINFKSDGNFGSHKGAALEEIKGPSVEIVEKTKVAGVVMEVDDGQSDIPAGDDKTNANGRDVPQEDINTTMELVSEPISMTQILQKEKNPGVEPATKAAKDREMKQPKPPKQPATTPTSFPSHPSLTPSQKDRQNLHRAAEDKAHYILTTTPDREKAEWEILSLAAKTSHPALLSNISVIAVKKVVEFELKEGHVRDLTPKMVKRMWEVYEAVTKGAYSMGWGQVKKIEIVFNPVLYEKFRGTRERFKEFRGIRGKDGREKLLFHGTGACNVTSY
jgi:hypothetical protein